ncbi:MAG: 50S ribosomal protein L19e [Candidatus Marsarchaeota archaeon]|nr:50S ribosomal protein L19e [Candidatus Marsarchaeota archaeon]MCL5106042.1 50S ribosomal protein L19e [Candidatus Marsarchaeota archaeon]
MSNKLVRRIAAQVSNKGLNKIALKPTSMENIKNALTRDDVKKLIKDGDVIVKKDLRNISFHSKVLKRKRQEGRARGPGKKKGTKKARGFVDYKKRIRGQRLILHELKQSSIIDNDLFKAFNKLVKGNVFQTKASLLNHIKSKGVPISEEKFGELKHMDTKRR